MIIDFSHFIEMQISTHIKCFLHFKLKLIVQFHLFSPQLRFFLLFFILITLFNPPPEPTPCTIGVGLSGGGGCSAGGGGSGFQRWGFRCGGREVQVVSCGWGWLRCCVALVGV